MVQSICCTKIYCMLYPFFHFFRLIVFLRKLRIGCAIIAQGTVCAVFAQVRTLFCQCARFAQDFLPMRNICARFVQDSTYAQYMRKICTRLSFFPNAQYMRTIVLISPMRKICARLHFIPQCARCVQDCTFFLYSPQPPMFQM